MCGLNVLHIKRKKGTYLLFLFCFVLSFFRLTLISSCTGLDLVLVRAGVALVAAAGGLEELALHARRQRRAAVTRARAGVAAAGTAGPAAAGNAPAGGRRRVRKGAGRPLVAAARAVEELAGLGRDAGDVLVRALLAVGQAAAARAVEEAADLGLAVGIAVDVLRRVLVPVVVRVRPVLLPVTVEVVRVAVVVVDRLEPRLLGGVVVVEVGLGDGAGDGAAVQLDDDRVEVRAGGGGDGGDAGLLELKLAGRLAGLLADAEGLELGGRLLLVLERVGPRDRALLEGDDNGVGGDEFLELGTVVDVDGVLEGGEGVLLLGHVRGIGLGDGLGHSGLSGLLDFFGLIGQMADI